MTRIIILAGILLHSATACQVPVFRYALERWQADPFRLQVIHKRPLTPAFEKALLTTSRELASNPPPVNLDLETLDVAKLSESQQLSVVGLELAEQFPAILLHPPASWGNATPLLLDGNESTLQNILHSPVRQRCIDDLLAGESAVWLLIESGDAGADQAAFNQLEAALKRAASEIQIPEGVLRPDEIDKAGNEVNLDDVLRSAIPLKISFKIERLSRSDPAEQVFIQLLTGPSGKPPDGPVIVPVFGRGRTPGPVPASAVTEERIVRACAYLCGACSCQVKSGNPGYDLLFRASWHEHLQDGLVVIEKALPPLPGVGDLSETPAETPAISGPVPPQPAIPMLWWIIGGGLAFTLITGTIFLTRRS